MMALLSFLAIVIFIVLLTALMGKWTQRTLEFWLTKFLHKKVSIPLWLSILIALILNGAALTINVLSELVRIVIK